LVANTGDIKLLACGTITHTLLTSVRRRRRDLAILKTIGFVGRHVRATVAWQATAIAGAAPVVSPLTLLTLAGLLLLAVVLSTW
jgi:ABC-type lipoprotein release transport system permease subunit